MNDFSIKQIIKIYYHKYSIKYILFHFVNFLKESLLWEVEIILVLRLA